MGIEGSVVAQYTPGDARELAGQRDGDLVPVQPLRRRREPRAEAISGPVVRAHQQHLCCLDQQRAQIFAASLGNAAKDGPAPPLYCRGTSPSQAAKSRPRSKASPPPIAATIAVEISGPTPGTLINCRHLASDRLRISISPVTVSIRSSRQHPSS